MKQEEWYKKQLARDLNKTFPKYSVGFFEEKIEVSNDKNFSFQLPMFKFAKSEGLSPITIAKEFGKILNKDLMLIRVVVDGAYIKFI